jgi:PPP family 3-phenylpropionic acid transporter
MFYASFGAGIPFLTLYYKYALRTPAGRPANYLIGVLLFIQSTMLLLSGPLAGIIGDKFHLTGRLISIFAFLTAIGSLIAAVPGMAALSLSSSFILIFMGMVLIGMFSRPLMPMIDSETLSYLHESKEDIDDYGKIRFFGSFGWVLSACLVGVILFFTELLYFPVIGFGAGYFLLGLIALKGSRAKPASVTDIPFRHLLRNRPFRRFLFVAVIMGFALIGSYPYTSYFLDDADVSYLFIGLAMGLAALPELPIMHYSRFFLRKLGSRGMILTGILFLTLKLFGFFFAAGAGSPLLFIFIQSLHGFGWATFYTGVVRYIDEIAHPQMRSTYQSMFHVPWSVMGAFGALFSGWLVEQVGSRRLMGINALILAGAAVIFLIIVLRPASLQKQN